jgi:hypothetical protein
MDHRSSARPQIPQRPAASQPATEEHVQHRVPKTWAPSVAARPSRKKWPFFAGVVVAITVVLLVGWWLWSGTGNVQQPRGDRYQAVFLDNGQVFFGKLKNVKGEYLVLENAYYTKKQDVPENATPEQKAAIENNISLAKVGSEVYGPETSMSIRSEQVIFWQNLKDDSKVSNAIKNAQ